MPVRLTADGGRITLRQLEASGRVPRGRKPRVGSVAAMEIREVAVVGLGTMGAGIAEVFARAGVGVVAIEVDADALGHGLGILEGSLAKAVSRGKLTEAQQGEIWGRIRPAASFSDAARVDMAIEVVPERMEIKRQILAELDRVCSPEAILATNTSSLSVTAIAAASKHPSRVIGMHFFNPAPVMRLVEVVSTVLTDSALPGQVADLARRLGKTPVQVSDRAGFVANALLLPYLNHAVRLLETGYASREDIDAAATVGIGLPMGPLALLDLIGLDTSLSILEILRAEFGGPRYTPAPLLRRLTDAGRTGRKAGRGLYDYAGGAEADDVKDGNEAAPSSPSTVTLIGSGRAAEAELASAIAAAGINVTRNPAHPSDLIVIVAGPDEQVLPAAIATGRAQQAVGFHPAGTDLIEVISTGQTGSPAAGAGAALAERLGKQAVHTPDRPGFLVGALLYPHLADAVLMVQDGYASVADVDTAMTLGCGYPQGPFQLLDKAGAAAVLDGLRGMHAGYGDPAFAPPPLLAEHAAAGMGFTG
jgi:3-hydroxybutyryl-CoA dehydrogenase